jgi:hypothetical protein
MSKRAPLLALVALVLLAATPVRADVPALEAMARIASCQKRIASAGARFAMQVIKNTLKCTNEVAECQIECDYGAFGPSCDTSPPPCCDSDDPNSTPGFTACMADADQTCSEMEAKIAKQEATKQLKIIAACTPLTPDELCGAQGEGLNFATLNAGCLALNPGYTCNITNLIACVGGPLQRQLTDQISGLLDARAGEAVAALNLQSVFPGIPIARKVKGQVAPNKMDVWAITGAAGDQVRVRVVTRDDNGNGSSNLDPDLVLLGSDGTTPIADTNVKNPQCGVTSVCGATCPTFNRSLPFSGSFYLAVKAHSSGGCTGGRYRLVVVSPGGGIPNLVSDDVDAS